VSSLPASNGPRLATATPGLNSSMQQIRAEG
jgi:hypothetical protein